MDKKHPIYSVIKTRKIVLYLFWLGSLFYFGGSIFIAHTLAKENEIKQPPFLPISLQTFQLLVIVATIAWLYLYFLKTRKEAFEKFFTGPKPDPKELARRPDDSRRGIDEGLLVLLQTLDEKDLRIYKGLQGYYGLQVAFQFMNFFYFIIPFIVLFETKKFEASWFYFGLYFIVIMATLPKMDRVFNILSELSKKVPSSE